MLTWLQAVDYAGVRRSIISRNSPLVDEDGYEVDSADDDERIEAAIASAAELNPYANIRIEREKNLPNEIVLRHH
jgi:hypothetical protein